MGRLGPLTSLALGRSPYDEIVQGEGESDPRIPLQKYDERGRAINPETKRINKDVIRSHNEVMLVIGVAEAENEATEAQADSVRRHDQYEQRIGKTMFYVGKAVETIGIWGADGMRQRLLVYKPFSFVPFMELWNTQRAQGQTMKSYLFAGLPSCALSIALKEALFLIRKPDWIFPLGTYLLTHLEVYTFLQRIGLLPSSSWIPNFRFFVPGTSYSPIGIPPLPSTISAGSILQWLGGVAVGVAPLAGVYILSRAAGRISRVLDHKIYAMLPKPTNPRLRGRVPRRALTRDSTVARAPENLEAPTPATLPTVEEEPRNGRDISRDEPTFRALEGQSQTQQESQAEAQAQAQAQSAGDTPPVSAIRRQSTFSLRADDFGSDDEETEVVSATLISFDVEATESSDTPPGVWSAELRPNVADARIVQEPRYRDNELTRLPAVRGAQLLALPLMRLLVAPLEALVWRSVARSFALRRGLSTAAMHGPGLLGSLTWMGVSNLVCWELCHLLFYQANSYAFVVLFAGQFRLTDEEWKEMDEMDELEAREDRD